MFESKTKTLDRVMSTFLWNRMAVKLGTDRQSVLRRFIESQYWKEDE